MTTELTINNTLHAAELAVFLKRVTFEDAYNRADGEDETERKKMAYRILRGLQDVEACLANAGFSAR